MQAGAQDIGHSTFRPGIRSFVLLVVITVMLVTVGAAMVVTNERTQRHRTVASTVGFSEAAARSADQVLSDDLIELDLIATSPALQGVSPSTIQTVLNAIDVSSAGFTGGVSFIGPTGQLFAATGRVQGAAPENLSREPYFSAIVTQGAKHYVGPGFTPSGQAGASIILAVPVRAKDGSTAGVVAGSLSLARVARHLTGFRFGGNDLIVLDRSNQVVVTGESGARVAPSQSLAVVKRLRASAPTAIVGATDPLGRHDRLIAAAASPTGGWLVIISRSSGSAFGADRHILELELAGLAVAALLAIALAWRGGLRLDALNEVANAAAAGEREVRERATRLRIASAELATSLTRRQVAENAVAAGRAALDARAASIVVREDEDAGTLRLVSQEGFPERLFDGWTRYELVTTNPSGLAVSTGRALFLDADSMARDFPTTAPRLADSGCGAWAVIPMRAKGEVFGALTLGFEDADALTQERRSEVVAYATDVAVALAWAGAREVEHEFALTLQRGLLPTRLPDRPDMVVTAEYLPANGVFDMGGDWYDALERPDGAALLVVGDVVGHGVSAIAAMGQLSSVCRAVADEASPAGLLDYLDRLARRLDSAVGTTAACVLVSPDRNSASYSIAGHPRPLLIEAEVVRELDEAVSIPLAYGAAQRVDTTISLQRPSTFVLFTDGLIERRDSTYTDRVRRLREIAARTPAAQLCSTIIEELAGTDGSPDDTVVMVVHLPADPGST